MAFSVFILFLLALLADGLRTTDKELHATQLSVAEYTNTTKQFHIVLSCGNFAYSTEPPFDLKWQTPSGSEVPSTSYADGQFRLQLPNPVPGGSYTCRVPASAAASVLVPGNSQQEVNATVQVDRVEARLTLLEAHNGQLMRQLTQVHKQYSQQLGQMKQQTEQFEALEQDNVQQKQQLSQLQRQNAALENQLQKSIYETTTRQVSFHVRVNSTIMHTDGETIVFRDVQLNHGGAYNTSTGRFTAPFTGIYFFAALTDSGSSSYYANADLMVYDDMMCRIDSPTPGQMGSCQATVRVTAGQSVWLRSYGGPRYFQKALTSFCGFLVTDQ